MDSTGWETFIVLACIASTPGYRSENINTVTLTALTYLSCRVNFFAIQRNQIAFFNVAILIKNNVLQYRITHHQRVQRIAHGLNTITLQLQLFL